jgi:hypothetical protein
MTIPGVTPFSGQLPVENEPASFPARAEALFSWLTANAAPEIDAVADGINDALNDNGTVLDATALAVRLTTNANTLTPTGGTGNAYTIVPAASVPSYANGQTYMLRPDRANTGAVTLNVGALGAVPVRKPNAAGSGFVELAANDWRANDVHIVAYQGSQFELLSVPLQAFVRVDSAQTVTAPWSFTSGLNGALGGTTPASAAVTSLAATSATVTANEFPAVNLVATNANSGWRIVRLVRGVNNFAISVLTQAGVFVSNAYEIALNATGATSHTFRVANTDRLSVTGGGATVSGALIVTGGASFGGTSTSHSLNPAADNTYDLGNLVSGAYWRLIYLRNAPVVSSDARLKENIRGLNAAEMRAAAKIERRTFTMNGKRKVGYIAQEIEAAMASEGLDAVEYGLVTIDGNGMRGVDYDAVTAFRTI